MDCPYIAILYKQDIYLIDFVDKSLLTINISYSDRSDGLPYYNPVDSTVLLYTNISIDTFPAIALYPVRIFTSNISKIELDQLFFVHGGQYQEEVDTGLVLTYLKAVLYRIRNVY